MSFKAPAGNHGGQAAAAGRAASSLDSHLADEKGKSLPCPGLLAPVPDHHLVHAGDACDPLAPVRNADPSRPFVVAQLGQSLDGRIATISGESRWINGRGALDHLHGLRASVDAVLVGVGTVIADDPQLDVRRVPGSSPARVILDPRGRLPRGCRCLREDGVRRFVIRADARGVPGDAEEIVLGQEDGELSPASIVAALFDRGLRRILVEGGAATISRFIDANCADRLHLLVAPVIIGSGKAGLAMKPVAALAQARRPFTRLHVLGGSDVLFDCDLRSGREVPV
jgi:riboflavin-specific deaminase-like protein